MASLDQEKIKIGWGARGFSCGLWVDPPGQVWADFVHDTDELVMLVQGEEEFEMNGRKYRLKVGEEFLISAGIKHTARNVGTTTSRWLYGYREK